MRMQEALDDAQPEGAEDIELRQGDPEQPNQERITTKYMTKYERARILGTRALQISMNAPIMVEAAGLSDPLEVRGPAAAAHAAVPWLHGGAQLTQAVCDAVDWWSRVWGCTFHRDCGIGDRCRACVRTTRVLLGPRRMRLNRLRLNRQHRACGACRLRNGSYGRR